MLAQSAHVFADHGQIDEVSLATRGRVCQLRGSGDACALVHPAPGEVDTAACELAGLELDIECARV